MKRRSRPEFDLRKDVLWYRMQRIIGVPFDIPEVCTIHHCHCGKEKADRQQIPPGDQASCKKQDGETDIELLDLTRVMIAVQNVEQRYERQQAALFPDLDRFSGAVLAKSKGIDGHRHSAGTVWL